MCSYICSFLLFLMTKNYMILAHDLLIFSLIPIHNYNSFNAFNAFISQTWIIGMMCVSFHAIIWRKGHFPSLNLYLLCG